MFRRPPISTRSGTAFAYPTFVRSAGQLDPPPSACADRALSRRRSLFGLDQVIGQGIDGTAMPSFAQLSSDDRWALAFHAGACAYPAGLADRGMQIWRSDPRSEEHTSELQSLMRISYAVFCLKKKKK